MVGVVFDGNIHSLGGFYLFEPTRNRSIAVTSVAIEEALAGAISWEVRDDLKVAPAGPPAS